MPDHLNKAPFVLLVGAGPMAQAYAAVLQAMHIPFLVVGRSKASAEAFTAATGAEVITGGLEAFIQNEASRLKQVTHAIVSVGVEALAETCELLVSAGIWKILLEKPGGKTFAEIAGLAETLKDTEAEIFLAYNRRFYASVTEAKRIIATDGGISSFNFEFSEWSHKIEPLVKAAGVKENWFLANSTHVVDLAFYLGGAPAELHAFAAGSLSWHQKSNFAGAGITSEGALFNYAANWQAPGRWSVELLTPHHRLYLKPLEGLAIQKLGSVAVEQGELKDELDKQFKPGLYCQVKAFLEGDRRDLIQLAEQAAKNRLYQTILSGGHYQSKNSKL